MRFVIMILTMWAPVLLGMAAGYLALKLLTGRFTQGLDGSYQNDPESLNR